MTSASTEAAPDVLEAVAILREGGVIALPTDTLYALAADATNTAAVGRVFAIKGREAGKPLPLFVDGAAMAASIGEVGPGARALVDAYWPGALTVVVRKRREFESEALAGGDTVGLRAPNHPAALAVVRALGRPVTATSANRSGGPDPVSADEVRRQLGDAIDAVLDRGECPVGVSSTVVDCTIDPPRILRPGAIAREDVARTLGGRLA